MNPCDPTNISDSDKLDKILSEVQSLKTGIAANTTALIEMKSTFDKKVSFLENQVELLIKDNSNLRKERDVQRNVNTKLTEKILKIESYQRRDCLLFCNVPDEKSEDCWLKVSLIIAINFATNF